MYEVCHRCPKHATYCGAKAGEERSLACCDGHTPQRPAPSHIPHISAPLVNGGHPTECNRTMLMGRNI